MKFIDLDALASKANRTVILRGTKYELSDMGVGQYIRFHSLLGKLNKAAAEGKEVDVLSFSKEIVNLAIPEMPQDHVDALNGEQIIALVHVIADVYPDESAAAATPQEGEGKAGE